MLSSLIAQEKQACDSCKVNYYQYVDSLEKKVEELSLGIDSLIEKPNQTFLYRNSNTKFSKQKRWAFSIPIALLILMILVMVWIIKKTGFDLKNALSEIKIVNNAKAMIESSSRLIAFFSAIVALILSCTIILISLYVFLQTGIIPDFGVLVNAVLALGIGVVPYSINRISGTFKSNNT